MILSMLAMMTRIPMSTSQPGALELSSKQHCQWIAECLSNSWTTTIKDMMDAYEEDHKGDGIIMWMCFLQECVGSSHEAIITAKEALHPLKLKLDNFQHNIKDCTTYCHENFRKIQAASDRIMSQHFINMFNMLKEAHSEEFRLQMLTWSRNWHAGTGEESTWMMMQPLAKVDLEYKRLRNLGQWQSSNPTIRLLHCK